jgi:hypothetical protein
MRDRNRIEFFLIDIGDEWKKFPDLRFGQLMENLSNYNRSKYGRDLFYLEEKEFLSLYKEYMRSIK